MNPLRGASGPRKPRVHWLGRVLRGCRPDRNPLRRGSDRAETAVFGALLAVFLAAAPFTVHAAGSMAYASSVREAQAQRAALHQVRATLMEKASAWAGYANAPGAAPEVTARWRAPDGRMRTGQVFVPLGGHKSSTVMVWTDQGGHLADAPLQHAQIVSRVELAEASAVAALAVLLIAAGWLVRVALNRRRMAAWEEDWLIHGPRWSPRR